jgi:ribosomal protein L17
MPDNEIPIKFTGDASDLTKAADEAKSQLEKASKSVEMLGDMIGIEVPEAIQKMIASSELVGPALAEAFAPLAIISFGIELIQKLSDKIIEVTNDMAGWDASAQAMYADLVKNNEAIVKFNQNLEIKKLHLNEIGKSGTELLQQQIKNATSETDILNERLKGLNAEKQRLNGSSLVTFDVADGIGGIIAATDQVKNKSLAIGDDLKNWDQHTKDVEKDITEIQNRMKELKEIKTPELEGQLKAANTKESISAGEQVLAAKKQVATEERQLAVDTAHAQVQQGKITAAQEEDIILASFQKERDATVKFLQDREALLLTGVAKESSQAKTIQETTASQIHAAEVKYQDETIKVVGNAAQKCKTLREKFAKDIKAIADKTAKDEQEASNRATREIIANAQKEAQAELKAANEKIALTAKEIEGEMIAAQQDEQVREALLARDLAQHKITKQQEIDGVRDAKLKELQQELIYLEQIQSLYAKGSEKWQEVQNRITKIQADAIKARAKADAAAATATNQEYQKLWSSMSGNFKSFADSITQGNQSIAQDFQKLYTGLLQSFINFLEQKYAKQVADAIQDRFFKKEQTSSGISMAASTGGAWAYADMASTGPEGLALAPGVAATTSSAIEGFQAGVISSAGGDWRVDGDRLNFVHKNETILPAGIAGKLRNMVEGGSSGGGVTVVVNHSVSAVDASSFQGHIRRHGNMIANEVTRALKRKGGKA